MKPPDSKWTLIRWYFQLISNKTNLFNRRTTFTLKMLLVFSLITIYISIYIYIYIYLYLSIYLYIYMYIIYVYIIYNIYTYNIYIIYVYINIIYTLWETWSALPPVFKLHDEWKKETQNGIRRKCGKRRDFFLLLNLWAFHNFRLFSDNL